MGSLPPFVSSCADPHRDGENRNHILAASPDDRVTPTRVGKGSGWHPPPTPTLGSSPLAWGNSGCGFDGSTWGPYSDDPPNPRIRTGGDPVRVPLVLETLM